MTPPTVSIISPLYQKGSYVEETVLSVVAQSVANWEMIIVNNGSTDDGPERAQRVAATDARIRVVHCPKRGPGAARNFGLDQALGEWILFLDADDLVEREYLDLRLATALAEPSAQIVAGPWEEFPDQESTRRDVKYPVGWKQSHRVLLSAAFAFAPWAIHAALVRRDHLGSALRWDETLDALPSEDCAFWFPVVEEASVVWSEKSGALYRRHSGASRDSQIGTPRLGFEACSGTIQANLRYLTSRGRRPSSEQAAVVVRVLRGLYAKAKGPDLELRNKIRREIRLWLRRTSFWDLRMLAWRLHFREFGTIAPP